MMVQQKQPILVTGAHRSGTTWVGKILSVAPGADYLHEPFNLKRRKGICNAPVKGWYMYVSDENSQQFYQPVKSTLEFHYSLKAEFSALKTGRDIVRMIRDLLSTTYRRVLVRPRPIIKDPFALFSARWYEDKFNAKIVILVRHPAAFVSSILKKGWDFPFEHWLEQPALLRDHLTPFADKIGLYTHKPASRLDQAILLWNTTHYVISNYKGLNPDWLIYRHEDLSYEPVNNFMKIFDTLGLKFTPKVERFLYQTTHTKNPINSEKATIFDINRDSKANIKTWQSRLSSAEIKYIQEATADISNQFYEIDDWK